MSGQFKVQTHHLENEFYPSQQRLIGFSHYISHRDTACLLFYLYFSYSSSQAAILILHLDRTDPSHHVVPATHTSLGF